MVVVVVEALFIDLRADVVIDTLAGVEIVVAAAVVSALEFAVSIPYFADVMIDTSIDALACVNVNIFTRPTTALEFAVPKSLEEFSWWAAAFDC